MNNDLISRDYVEKIIISEFVDLQDGTEEWRTYVNDTCESILNKVHNVPTVEPTYVSDMPDDKVKDLQNLAIDYGEGIAVFRRCQKGEWRETGYETGALGITYRQTQCSNCGWEHALPMWYSYCPSCGAKMRCGAKMEVSLNE